jgi:hypothetical protein
MRGKEAVLGLVYANHAIQFEMTILSKDAPSVRGLGKRIAQDAARGKDQKYSDLVMAVGESSSLLCSSPQVPTLWRDLAAEFSTFQLVKWRRTYHGYRCGHSPAG